MLSLRNVDVNELKKKIRSKGVWFLPAVSSLIVFVAGRNSVKESSFLLDILILLCLWFTLFGVGMLLVCFPHFFDGIEN